MADKLLLDLGNTALKWGWLEQGAPIDIGRWHYSGSTFEQHLSRTWESMSVPGSVYISSVANSAVAEDLNSWIQTHWNIEPHFLKVTESAIGVRCAYRDIEKLGIDRWAALIAGYQYSTGGVCIVDCGTAVTIDAVDYQGVHLGGFILPGIKMMADSLIRNTGIIAADPVHSTAFWGEDTESAIYLGSVRAITALVENAVKELQLAGGDKAKLYITGGDAERILGVGGIDGIHRPDLVLEGVALLAGTVAS